MCLSLMKTCGNACNIQIMILYKYLDSIVVILRMAQQCKIKAKQSCD